MVEISMIKDLKAEETAQGDFLVLDLQMKTAKNGSAYLALRIGDRSGEIPMKIWDFRSSVFPNLAAGKAIRLNGAPVKTFNGSLQIEMDGRSSATLQVLESDELNYDSFLPGASEDPAFFWEIIDAYRAQMTNPPLIALLSAFFDDGDFRREFGRVPAALRRHHVYIGGLLEHTAGVLRLAMAAAEHYTGIYRDLLITGALLHDLGKLRTYRVGRGFEGTDEGRLIGHLVLGTQMVREKIQALRNDGVDFPSEDEEMLTHLLVSHHGIMEWGSPVEPLLIEACILHHADNFDAEVNKFQTILKQHEDSDEAWSSYDSNLGRSIYLHRGVRDEEKKNVAKF